MGAKKKPAAPEPVHTEKDAYEEGAFAALTILKDYIDAERGKLRNVDAGIATGLLGPVVDIVGMLRSRVESNVVDHLHERRERERAESKVTP